MTPRQDADIIGRRELVYTADDGSASVVSVVVRKPVQGERAFLCRIEIDGLGSRLDRTDDRPSIMDVHGIDSLQALTIALSAIFHGLRPHERSLSWFGAPASHGFPYVFPLESVVLDVEERDELLASFDAQILAAIDVEN